MDTGEVAHKARKSASIIATASTEQKNTALLAMADNLSTHKQKVLDANSADMDDAKQKGVEPTMVARLGFGEKNIASRMESLNTIASLADPVGQKFACSRRPTGLEVSRVRVPLGVILMIFEARPHVTVNAGAFCLKSGNAAILRGGSEAKRSNAAIGELWQKSLAKAGLPEDIVQVISGSHEEIEEILAMDDLIDLVIPRGGKRLIESVSQKSRIPVIKHFEGNCHVYIDEGADIDAAIQISLDGKTLMPQVCNATESILIAESETSNIAKIIKAFQSSGVTVRGCEKTQAAASGVEPATEEDWATEYLDMVVSMRVVKDVTEAACHINEYGSHHTDTIVTDSESRAREFTNKVDSGVVLVNASTMFCDGASLGMGAEIGISTDRLHARGPMGLEELTTYKFEIVGAGHIMGGPYTTG